MGKTVPAAFDGFNLLTASARTLWRLIAVTNLAVITPLTLIPAWVVT